VSDGGSWNEPAAPGGPLPSPPVAVPVTGVGTSPVPLPLAPGAPSAGGRRNRPLIAMIVAAAVLGVLGICAVSWLAGDRLMSGGGAYPPLPPGPEVSQEPAVMAMTWAGDGRYAIVEYQSGGEDATSSVIAWDALSGETMGIDGFRLVATEPSSTQVWVTRAVNESDDESDESYDSPWSQPNWGGSAWDGAGVAWVWDPAKGGPPEVQDRGTWRPWVGSLGREAGLSVDPSIGLWPSKLTFSGGGEAAVAVDFDRAVKSFLPIGWSPTGRYFAVRVAGDGGSDPSVVIVDALYGTTATVRSDNADGDDSDWIVRSGAAWDNERDVMWMVDSRLGADPDPEGATVSAVDPRGAKTVLQQVPASWRGSLSDPVVLGPSSKGVLIGVGAPDTYEIWRIEEGRPVKVGELPDSQFVLDSERVHASSNGLLVQIFGEPTEFSLTPQDSAAVVDLNGKNLRTIWPKP
jgi:hypothetical protein